jgi:hypothetical protein
MGNAGFGDMLSRFWSLVGVYILYALPIVLYATFLERLDWIFWVLLAWAVIFFPIGHLAMVILDSPSAMNPFMLLAAICRVFLPYVGLLLLLAAGAGLMEVLDRVLGGFGPGILRNLLSRIVHMYMLMVLAHLLGRFYWRHDERLDWGI